ncbi:MAG TPA: metallophosphoesterase [Terriglobia bacterium]|nr:metallophosphoesterase [Terriglobia bacterium]
MSLICAHVGDVHLQEDHYFGDTAQCLEWYVTDAIRSSVDLFVVNGDASSRSTFWRGPARLSRKRKASFPRCAIPG